MSSFLFAFIYLHAIFFLSVKEYVKLKFFKMSLWTYIYIYNVPLVVVKGHEERTAYEFRYQSKEKTILKNAQFFFGITENFLVWNFWLLVIIKGNSPTIIKKNNHFQCVSMKIHKNLWVLKKCSVFYTVCMLYRTLYLFLSPPSLSPSLSLSLSQYIYIYIYTTEQSSYGL